MSTVKQIKESKWMNLMADWMSSIESMTAMLYLYLCISTLHATRHNCSLCWLGSRSNCYTPTSGATVCVALSTAGHFRRLSGRYRNAQLMGNISYSCYRFKRFPIPISLLENSLGSFVKRVTSLPCTTEAKRCNSQRHASLLWNSNSTIHGTYLAWHSSLTVELAWTGIQGCWIKTICVQRYGYGNLARLFSFEHCLTVDDLCVNYFFY